MKRTLVTLGLMALVGTVNARAGEIVKNDKFALNLNESPEPADAADALAVALCHALKRGSSTTTYAALGTRHSALP